MLIVSINNFGSLKERAIIKIQNLLGEDEAPEMYYGCVTSVTNQEDLQELHQILEVLKNSEERHVVIVVPSSWSLGMFVLPALYDACKRIHIIQTTGNIIVTDAIRPLWLIDQAEEAASGDM